MSRDSKGTTETGYLNQNGQVVIRDTGFMRHRQISTGLSACVLKVRTTTTVQTRSDCHLRLCPKCQKAEPKDYL